MFHNLSFCESGREKKTVIDRAGLAHSVQLPIWTRSLTSRAKAKLRRLRARRARRVSGPFSSPAVFALIIWHRAARTTSRLICSGRRSSKFQLEFDFLFGQQSQYLPTLGNVRPLVCKNPITTNILSAKEPIQSNSVKFGVR